MAHAKQSEKQGNWDATFLKICAVIAVHSHDPKFKVGSVIVNNETGGIVGMGYNGRGKGRPNERLSLEEGRSGYIHGENNAIARTAWESTATYTLYCTHSPCFVCGQLILNQPITRVVFGELYTGPEALLSVQELQQALGSENVVNLDPQAPVWRRLHHDDRQMYSLLFGTLDSVHMPATIRPSTDPSEFFDPLKHVPVAMNMQETATLCRQKQRG